ncbi:amidohydrolase family protein, partial [Streptomyces sp. TRM76130]|nr:amidohydrolase family protein [Streptomyces sp. TRM76130]
HAVIDLLEEARAMELNERLRTRTRGHWTVTGLLRAATADGHAALGWDDAGAIEAGARADLTTVALDSVRTAGPPPGLGAEAAVFAATAADVR